MVDNGFKFLKFYQESLKLLKAVNEYGKQNIRNWALGTLTMGINPNLFRCAMRDAPFLNAGNLPKNGFRDQPAILLQLCHPCALLLYGQLLNRHQYLGKFLHRAVAQKL